MGEGERDGGIDLTWSHARSRALARARKDAEKIRQDQPFRGGQAGLTRCLVFALQKTMILKIL